MLTWLKRIVGAKSSLPEQSYTLLAADLARLDSVSRGLGGRALRYVLDGDDPSVLEVLASIGAGAALELKCLNRRILPRTEPRQRFFATLPPLDASFHLRLALVLEAATRRDTPKLILDWLPGVPRWLEIFLWEASTFEPNSIKSDDASFLDFELLEQMLKLADSHPELPLRAALSRNLQGWENARLGALLSAVKGFAAAAARHPGVIREVLNPPDAKRRVHVLELMTKHRVDPLPHTAQLVELAVSSAKTVRSQAQALLSLVPEAAEPHVRAKASDGTTDERMHAAGLLWNLRAEAARVFLGERRVADSSPKVRKAIEDLLGASLALEPAAAAHGAGFELPPLPDMTPRPLPASIRDALRNVVERWHRNATAANVRARAQNPKWQILDPPPVTGEMVDRIFRVMQAPTIREDELQSAWAAATEFRWRVDENDLKGFLVQPGLDLVHVVRLLGAAGLLDAWGRALRFGAIPDRLLRHYRTAHRSSFGLRDVGAAFRASGLEPALIGWTLLDRSWQRAFAWEADAVWPYFVEHAEILEEVFGLRPAAEEKDRWVDPRRRPAALAVLECLPRVPPALKPRLWEIALGSARGDRASAQRCLGKEPETAERIVSALDDGRQETRAVAAEWLADIRHSAAIPALEGALHEEKQDAAKAALMGALEALGAEVDRFLDRPGLAREAEKGLRKGVPAALGWFPFDRLPEVRWSDSGEPVARDVLLWLVVQGHRLGSPEPSALLRRYARQMDDGGRQALGRFVLEAWLAQDTELPTQQEVDAKATALAQQWSGSYPGKSLQEIAEMFARGLLEVPKGTAIGDKGVLSVAGACARADVVPVVQQYLRTWYGRRAAQCRALLQMLSWVEHPAAIQLVLATATRFRTEGIRREAEKQAQLIAERRSWTIPELADRTIPTAGFDENGELELDYGERRFVARIADDLSVTLTGPEGRTMTALPDARASESPEVVAAAKKALSAAKKELKTVLALQRERLYEAMCTQRAWSAEDWEAYLHRHPVVGRHCRRLVWVAHAGEQRLGTFRALGDGSLTTATDEAFELAPGSVVHVAHACNTPDAEGRAWTEHLAAYEIEPLFAQFARVIHRIPPDGMQETRLLEYQGHLVEAFKLRARAAKAGYVRGTTEDGGWFYTYVKHLPTLGLDAVIEFSGNALPEQNRTVALRTLRFTRKAEGPGVGADEDCTLGEVPPVLLSECWNDLRSIAAEGTGFDPDWERKVQ